MNAKPGQRVNIAAPEFRHFPHFPEGFRPGIARFGTLLGAATTGMSVYELPPGQAIGPYHYENPEEEWLLVLDGRPTLRHPDGEDELQPWDVVFFPPGPGGAHAVRRLDGSRLDVLEHERGRRDRLSRQRQDRHLDRQRRRRPHRQADEWRRLLGRREPKPPGMREFEECPIAAAFVIAAAGARKRTWVASAPRSAAYTSTSNEMRCQV
jgi:uncharacterized cupin superfamily protein